MDEKEMYVKIRSWIVRIRDAGKNQKILAKEAGLTPVTVTRLMRFQFKEYNSKVRSSVVKVENVLKEWGV